MIMEDLRTEEEKKATLEKNLNEGGKIFIKGLIGIVIVLSGLFAAMIYFTQKEDPCDCIRIMGDTRANLNKKDAKLYDNCWDDYRRYSIAEGDCSRQGWESRK